MSRNKNEERRKKKIRRRTEIKKNSNKLYHRQFTIILVAARNGISSSAMFLSVRVFAFYEWHFLVAIGRGGQSKVPMDLLMPEMLCEMLYLTQNCQTSDTLFVRSYAWTEKRGTCKNSQIAKDACQIHTHSVCVCVVCEFDILPGISFHCWCCKCAINGRTVILAMVMVVWWFDLTGSWACFISRYKHTLAELALYY